MIYLALDTHHIKLLSLSKAILSQYNASFFQKAHEAEILDKGKVKNIDVLASAIKEAITLASPKEIKDKEIFLILPQDSFEFRRYDIPYDISESAILPFVKDKVRADIPFDVESSMYDYQIVKQNGESKVLFYALNGEAYQQYNEVFKLLGLSIKTVIPDTLSYFKLFEKTLKKDKKEVILFAHYETANEYGYLYDSYGLLESSKLPFKEPIEETIKKEVDQLEKKNLKPNRLILSGPSSDTIRQDYFTKNVGVWTNPLKKIITNFYEEYLKLIIVSPNSSFSFMDYAICIGGFIFSRENENFSLSKGKAVNKQRNVSLPSFHISLRDVVIFLASTALSFGVIFFFPHLSTQLKSSLNFKIAQKPTPVAVKVTPIIPTATPTPSFTKESLNIKVLNGGGTPGKATEVKNILKKAGYGEILTGNADNFDYTKTVIQTKKDKDQAYDMIKTDFADYTTTTTHETLKDTETPDVIIIIGQDFK